MSKIFYLQYSKLGAWSLSKDIKNAEYFFDKIGVKRTRNIFNAKIIYSPWYNVFFNAPIYYYFIYFLKKVTNVKLIIVVSNDITGMEKEKIDKLKNIVDRWVVPSERVHSFLKDCVREDSIYKIPFYVPVNKFQNLDFSRKDISEKLDIDFEKIKDRILIGTFQRDSLGSDLKKAKWQKNPQMIVDICKKLPRDSFILVLAGPRRHFLVNECRTNNIPYIFIGNEKFIDGNEDDIVENNLDEETVNLLYNLIDVYIVGSRSEGGPKAIVEAALSKTLIISTDVGFASEYLHSDLIYDEEKIDKAVKLILNYENREMVEAYIDHNYKKTTKVYSEENFKFLYKSLIQKL